MVRRKSQIPDFGVIRRIIVGEATRIAETEVADYAEVEADQFRRKIRRQDFASFAAIPLSDKWLRKKLAAGADLRTMIATGHYVRNIRTFRRRVNPRSILWRIGHHPQMLARDLKGRTVSFSLMDAAWVHEKGSASAHIPARPHWRPHYEFMRLQTAPVVRRRIKRLAVRSIRRRLARELKKG